MRPSKRALDLGLALALLVPLLPMGLVLAGLLLVTQGRPLFYAAERMKTPEVGFRLWKFRTMRPDPGDSGVTGSDKADRITPMGRLLRRTRLDELPQLWNILRGDISFVGPRPPLRLYVEAFPALYARVLESRPGVTGLATLRFHKREEVLLAGCATAEETDRVYRRRCVPVKARLDLIYQKNASVCFDLALIWETARGVLKR